MTTLVTGGCVFVGLNVVEQLLEQGDRVVAFDRQTFPARDLASARRDADKLHIVQGDVLDEQHLNTVFRELAVKNVIHTAAITASAERESGQPGQIVETNIRGTLAILAAARQHGCRRVIYVGSGQAYGRTHDEGVPLFEDRSPSRPTDIYGITKLAAEQMSLRLAELWSLDVVCVRVGSVFGPWEFDTGVRDMLSPYLQATIRALRGEDAILPAYEPWRDWIYSRDVAAGLLLALGAERPSHNLYHLSSGLDWSGTFNAWCTALSERYPRFSWRVATDEQPNVSFVVARDRAAMNTTRIANDLGFKIQFGPHQAYPDYMAWIAEHESFILTHAR